MASIASLEPTANQALQSSTANAEAGNVTAAQAEVAKLGLPPASLAAAAVANTVNAGLATSQWGVDPNSVGGVFGGPAATGGLFGGGNLLPLLNSISKATAEQALSLIGIQTPKPGAAGSTNAAAAARAAAAANAQTLFGAADSTPVVVDPLWGRDA